MLNFTEIKERNNNIRAFKKKDWRRSINGTFQFFLIYYSFPPRFHVETII